VGFFLPAITQTQAETQLASWLAADAAVAQGQSYEHEGAKLTRADAQQIRSNIKFWNSEVLRLSRGGIRIMGATFTD